MKILPIAKLRGLLAVVSGHGKQHLFEVEADLTQTTYLLSEAVEKLGASFMAVHETVAAQQQAIEALKTQYQISNAELQHLGAFKQSIEQDINAVITAMQFQDLTSQLIARAIKRVNGLKDLLEELAVHGDEMDPKYEQEEIAQFIEDINHSFDIGSRALSGGLWCSVDQKNMATGDVDLF